MRNGRRRERRGKGKERGVSNEGRGHVQELVDVGIEKLRVVIVRPFHVRSGGSSVGLRGSQTGRERE